MASRQAPPSPSKAREQPSERASPTPSAASSPPWKEALYAPERVAQFVKGEMSLQELQGITSREMVEMASTGYALLGQGQFPKALSIFKGLAALSPTIPWFQTAIGVVHLSQDRLDEALAAFNQAVALDGHSISALVHRGEALLRKGDLVKAAQDFKAAIREDPKGQDPLTRRAKALAAAALRQLEAKG